MISITDLQKELIENGTLAFCTVDTAGAPNVIAVGYVKVVSGNQLLITDNFFSKTLANLNSNTSVALAVWTEDGEVGFQFKGSVEYFTSGPWKEQVDGMPENDELLHKGAVLVTVREIWDLTGTESPSKE